MGSTERRSGHHAIPAWCPVALQRCTDPAPGDGVRRLDVRRHDSHSDGRCPTSGRHRPAGPLTPINPSTVPADRTHVVGLRPAQLADRFSRPVVPPSVPTAGRALAQVLAVSHPVHRAERRERLRRHAVGLRRGGRWFVLPRLSAPAGHRLSLRVIIATHRATHPTPAEPTTAEFQPESASTPVSADDSAHSRAASSVSIAQLRTPRRMFGSSVGSATSQSSQ
jgi:hypothetical protein